MKGKLAVFTIVLAVFAIVLVATTVADAQICMCQMCRTDVPGCETVQYPRGCACILSGTSCRICGNCIRTYGCIGCPPGCPCLAQKAAAEGPASQAYQDEMKLVPDRTKNPWTTSKALTDVIRVHSNTLATILVLEQRDKQRALPMFLVSNGPNVIWSPIEHPHKGATWTEDRDGDVWTIRLIDPPLPPDDSASPAKLVLDKDKWALYDRGDNLVANGSVESTNASRPEPAAGPQSGELNVVPDKNKNPWITSKTLEETVRGYSHTLARLLKEEQQDKQRVLPVFLTSNGPGVLWSDTNPNAAHTTWQLDRDGDVWTIRLLEPPLPPDDAATSPTKETLIKLSAFHKRSS